MVDMGGSAGGQRQLSQTLRSSVSTFVINGAGSFPFELLEDRVLAGKRIFGAITWASERVIPTGRVLTDFTAGGRMVARLLAARGCRRPLVVGPSNTLEMLDRKPGFPCCQFGFADECRALGLAPTRLPIDPDGPDYPHSAAADWDALDTALRGPGRVDAVFGLRDVDAWIVQSRLARHHPDLLGKVVIVGFGDTPWSQAATPQFTSVAFNLEEVCGKLLHLLISPGIKDGSSGGGLVLVPPILIERNGLRS